MKVIQLLWYWNHYEVLCYINLRNLFKGPRNAKLFLRAYGTAKAHIRLAPAQSDMGIRCPLTLIGLLGLREWRGVELQLYRSHMPQNGERPITIFSYDTNALQSEKLYLRTCPSEDKDQPVHPCSFFYQRFRWPSEKHWIPGYPKNDTDQTVEMRRLIWIFARRIDKMHFTLRLIAYVWFCHHETRLYNFDPLKPHFYIIKLGFTGVYIIFLISAQKHRLWLLVRTASPRRFLRVPTIYVLSRNKKNISDFYLKIFSFWR